MLKRIEVNFKGRVQGVGFRFTVIRLAGASGIKGYVKNLDDASVELVAEGKEEDLILFLNKIKDDFKSYISDTKVNWQEARGEFGGFKIAF